MQFMWNIALSTWRVNKINKLTNNNIIKTHTTVLCASHIHFKQITQKCIKQFYQIQLTNALNNIRKCITGPLIHTLESLSFSHVNSNTKIIFHCVLYRFELKLADTTSHEFGTEAVCQKAMEIFDLTAYLQRLWIRYV